jgi:uncharacterized protein Yka (UPF0111/DUF47 family)
MTDYQREVLRLLEEIRDRIQSLEAKAGKIDEELVKLARKVK